MKTALTDEIQWKGAQHEKAIPYKSLSRQEIKGGEIAALTRRQQRGRGLRMA